MPIIRNVKMKFIHGVLELVDGYDDSLHICHEGRYVYISVNEGVGVMMTRARAIKMAKAIIEELEK